MDDEIPMLCDALRVLRTAQRRKQEDVARTLGTSTGRLSGLENGTEAPRRGQVERAAEGMRLPREAVDWALVFLERLRAATAPPGPGGEDSRRERARLAADIGSWASAAALTALDRLDRRLVLYEERRRAELLWDRLGLEVPANRRVLVREAPEYHLWALAELLWKKSLQAAGDNADRAVELADLSVQVAERAPGDPEWQAAVRANAHGHHANALRVKGDHAAAERAFAAAFRNWSQGAAACPEIGGEARLLGFQASLRRDQRRFEEAEVLIERALAKDEGEEAPYLLINKARLRREMGNLEGALETLEQALPHLDALAEPQLAFTARSNGAYCLSLLGRHEEAERWLQEAWRAAEPAAGELDRLRLVWIGGRVAAGTGRPGEGIAALEQVRRAFLTREMAFDAALAALELAALYLEQGEPARVRALVHEMLPAFEGREIHREARAALSLFQQAVEQERATIALVRAVLEYLHRARHNPGLRFEPQRVAREGAPPGRGGAGRSRRGGPPASGRKAHA